MSSLMSPEAWFSHHSWNSTTQTEGGFSHSHKSAGEDGIMACSRADLVSAAAIERGTFPGDG